MKIDLIECTIKNLNIFLSSIHQRTFRILTPQPNPTRLKRQLKANDIKTLIFFTFSFDGQQRMAERGLMMQR